MKKFKFRKFVSKTMFTSLLVCLPFGLLVDRVQAGSGSSCVAKNPEPEPLIEPDPDGWFSFDGDNVRNGKWFLRKNGNDDIIFKVRFTGDVPNSAFSHIYHNRAEFFLLNATSIGDCAFSEFNNLLSVNLPDGLKTIGREAFRETAISSINLPSSLEHLGNIAFGATNLTDVTIPGGIKNLDSFALFACCSKLRNIKLENGIRRIGANVFGDYDCWSNAKFLSGDRMNKRIALEIPDSVVELDDRFCCDLDGNNTAIETIKWNGQEFSECNWNYDVGLERFLDAFEAKSGNTLLRHRNKFERDSSGGKRPRAYACRPKQKVIIAGSHYYSLKDKVEHEKVTAAIWLDHDGDYRYYYVTDLKMKSYDSIPDAISAGVDMSRIMYGKDGPVVDLAKAIKELKKENRGPRFRKHH